MLRNHVRRLEQRTLVSLLSTLTKCAETHIRRLRRCPFYNKPQQSKIILQTISYELLKTSGYFFLQLRHDLLMDNRE